jgi:regulator of protease activity HflC (stomatin/prohibitin superfamily)
MSSRKNTDFPFQGKLMKYGFFILIFLIFSMILSNTTFITIPAGHKGIKFKRFAGGIDKERTYNQGFQVVAPWNDLIVYDIRTNEGSEEMEVLSKNGLNIYVDLSYRFMPIPEKIGYLHDEIGPNYVDRIIIPEIRSATREVIGQYLPEELYSTKREAIQDEIFSETKKSLTAKYIILDAILIREVKLPEKLKAAIEAKLEEEQLSFQYEFKLDRERREAERKIIEAQAKADANRILNASLSNNILKDKGIEATLKLAESPNSKIVIVGSGENGLPLILNNQ